MKAQVRTVITEEGFQYEKLVFVCPGCVAGGPPGYEGLHMLTINSKEMGPSWDWDGNLEAPTLSPSILSNGYCRCHSFLKNGIFEFLADSDHPLSGANVPIPDLPEWAIKIN